MNLYLMNLKDKSEMLMIGKLLQTIMQGKFLSLILHPFKKKTTNR